MAAKIKHTQSANRRVNIYRRFPSGTEEEEEEGYRGEKKKGMHGERMVENGPPWGWETVLWGTVVLQVQEAERNARGGERTRVRDTLPRVVLTTPISPPVPLMHSLFSRRRRRRRRRRQR